MIKVSSTRSSATIRLQFAKRCEGAIDGQQDLKEGQGLVHHPIHRQGIRRHDQIQFTPGQGGQRIEMPVANKVELHVRPGLTIAVHSRNQREVATLALNGHVQAPTLPPPKGQKGMFRTDQFWQYCLCGTQ